jgi:hypothetical protein
MDGWIDLPKKFFEGAEEEIDIPKKFFEGAEEDSSGGVFK